MLSNDNIPVRRIRPQLTTSGLTREARLDDVTLQVSRSLLCPKKVYGRAKEQQLLLRAFRRVADKSLPSSEVVFVHGRSGAGKTALVQSMNKLFLEDTRDGHNRAHVLFVAGKYDQQLSTDPYSALSSALSDLVKKVTTHNAPSLSRIRTAVLDSVDIEDLPTLAALVPNLNRIVCAQGNAREFGRSNQDQAYAKLLSTVCSFVRSLIAATSPTVIFLDDLQFASDASIELIKALATNVSIRGMLLVLTYRSEEVKFDSCLKSFVNTMLLRKPNDDKMFRHSAHEIEVKDLLVNDIDQIVRSVTKIDDEEDTLSLSRIILQKTHGQAFHVIQFLEMLKDRRFLYFENGKYRFDLNQVQEETNVSDNVASLVSGRIEMLPGTTRKLLEYAACLGFCFATEHFVGLALSELNRDECLETTDADIVDNDECLQSAMDHVERIELVLSACLEEGLLEFATEKHVKFAHDQIHEAILTSIPPKTKQHIHLRIGKYLLDTKLNVAPVTETLYFLAADQFSRSHEIICDVKDVADLCRVNLVAGKLAVAKCSFAQGVEFLQVAVAMASQADLWSHHHDLALDVFTLSAEYESHAGRFERSYEMVNMVLSRATKLDDKLRAYYVRLDGLAYEQRLVEAVDLGLMLLEKIGEKVPRQLTTIQVVGKTMKISWLMRRRGMYDVGTTHEMSMSNAITAMKILSLLWTSAWYSGDAALFVAVTLKSMILTVKWGLSPFSACALAAFARLLVGLHRMDESYRVGQFALEVHKKCGSKENEGVLFLLLAGFVNHFREACRDQLPLISRVHDSAFASGRTLLAIVAVLARLQVSFVVGTPLSALNQDCEALLSKNPTSGLATTCGLPVIQLISCLQDSNRRCNPFVLSGEVLDESEFRALCEASGNERALLLYCTYQIAQAFFFHHWDRAVEIYKSFVLKHKALWKTHEAVIAYPHLSMWIGSAHMVLARLDSRYISKARQFRRELGRAGAAGNPDAVVLKKILEAEYAVLTSKPTKIRDAFECAIASCRASGFVHYEAHLSERLGIILVESGHFEIASRYISNAVALFETWNAAAKVRSTTQLLEVVKRQIRCQVNVCPWSSSQIRLSSYLVGSISE